MTSCVEERWTELFNSSSLPTTSRKTFSEAVDEVVEAVWSNETERLDRDAENPWMEPGQWLLDDFIREQHDLLWFRREEEDELDAELFTLDLSGFLTHFHEVARGKIDEGLKSRFACFQANFRRRHCLIKMIREMNEKCCRGTGFYSENY